MITIKRFRLITLCLLIAVIPGKSQLTSVPWSSFSQALTLSGGPGTQVASLLGASAIGGTSGGALGLTGGFLAGISRQSAVTGMEGRSSLPLTYELYQNYPNPFNPVTTISYDLPAFSRVTIHVFNIVGQHIATLVDQEQPAGRYRLVWNGRTDRGIPAASGVYFYRIAASERLGKERQFTSTRKLLFLK